MFLGKSLFETNFKVVPIINFISDVSGTERDGSSVILSCVTTRKSFADTSTCHASIHSSLLSHIAKFSASTHPGQTFEFPQ